MPETVDAQVSDDFRQPGRTLQAEGQRDSNPAGVSRRRCLHDDPLGSDG
jgi:hypothetical protein